MLETSGEQLLQEVVRAVDEFWQPVARTRQELLADYTMQPGWLIARCARHPYYGAMSATLARLRARYSGETLGELASDLYFHLQNERAQNETRAASGWSDLLRSLTDVAAQGDKLQITLNLVSRARSLTSGVQAARHRGLKELHLLCVLNACIVVCPPADILERIATHLRHVCEHFTLRPGLQDCLNLLVGLPSSPRLSALLEDLQPVSPYAPGNDWSYLVYEATNPFQGILRLLLLCDALSYDVFQHMARLLPYRFMQDFFVPEDSPAFRKQIMEYRQRLIAEVAADLREKNCQIILSYQGALRGADWLLQAARLHSSLRMKNLVGVGSLDASHKVEQAVIRLARAADVEPAATEERQALLTKLRQFPQETLKALFGVAAYARRLIAEVLGWQEAVPLVELIEELAGRQFVYGEGVSADMPNSTDALSGVLDVAAVRAVLERVPIELAQEILALLCKAKAGVENTALLVRAVGGWNRASVEQGLKRNGQLSIKAYGLLPLTRGEDEALERYLRLQEIARAGHAFGPGRRATHAAAVQAALENLAQVAGYNDAAHLEWEMETKAVQDLAFDRRAWTAGDYQWSIVLEESAPAIKVTRAGRILKAVPKEVRACPGYQEAKEVQTRLREHIGRLRRGLLERLLTTSETLMPSQLSRLLTQPTARNLLSQLVLRADDGSMGLLEGEVDAPALRGLDGALHPISTPVTVAHPYHLYHAGTLSAWQHEIVHRRIVQPLKQVFRELYLLTPAEEETRTYSRRFLGHRVDGAITVRLLSNRGWRVRRHDDAYTYKIFPGLRAVLPLPHNAHFLGEAASVAEMQEIWFEPYPLSAAAGGKEQRRVPLTEVPPLIFSEVMRDADLVAAVAGKAAGGYVSYESYERVRELIRTLLDDLGLQGVTVDGHFAYVQGKLARYRVHLGNAAIHIEPGGHLCIVPQNWGQRHERLFLPFVADAESRVSEVISKILLLLNDDQIKDESILRQIRAQTGG